MECRSTRWRSCCARRTPISGCSSTRSRAPAIPAWFERGTRRPDPAGRAFLALLACAEEHLSARRFAEYLSLGQVPRGARARSGGSAGRRRRDDLADRAGASRTIRAEDRRRGRSADRSGRRSAMAIGCRRRHAAGAVAMGGAAGRGLGHPGARSLGAAAQGSTRTSTRCGSRAVRGRARSPRDRGHRARYRTTEAPREFALPDRRDARRMARWRSLWAMWLDGFERSGAARPPATGARAACASGAGTARHRRPRRAQRGSRGAHDRGCSRSRTNRPVVVRVGFSSARAPPRAGGRSGWCSCRAWRNACFRSACARTPCCSKRRRAAERAPAEANAGR